MLNITNHEGNANENHNEIPFQIHYDNQQQTQKMLRIWRNWNLWPLLVRVLNGTVAVENSMVVLKKIKHIITIWSSNSTCGYISKRIENRDSNRYLIPMCRSICNRQKMGTTQISIDGCMDKQNVVYMYNGILFSINKEWNSDTCSNMNEP